uniref:Ribosomal protein S14 n=1 Tax=Panagrolaimus sp. JU765 TaxID=591449 RepID=A0AC34RC94_9BILA
MAPSKSLQNFNYRTNKYSLKQVLEARRKAERDLNSPIIIPVNPTIVHPSITNRLALAQLRDCVFVGSSCAGLRNMDATQSSKYIDQMQAFLSTRNVIPSKKRFILQ